MIAALVHAAGAQQLPVEELRPYMASMRMDCGRLRIQTREELDRYMDGSGASVGRIMAVILGAPDESERLGRLGVAFQLTNFLRDLREDYALDRIYLPADERERHGVGEGDLAAASASPALRELVASDVRRARELFRRDDAGAAHGDPVRETGNQPRARRLLRRPRPDRAERLRRARPGEPTAGRRPGTRRGELAVSRRPEQPLVDEHADVVVCGASFAGLAVARELAGTGADVLVLDRDEIGAHPRRPVRRRCRGSRRSGSRTR